MNVQDTTSELYNELLEIYYDEYYYLSHAKRKKMNHKFKPKKGYDHRKEESWRKSNW